MLLHFHHQKPPIIMATAKQFIFPTCSMNSYIMTQNVQQTHKQLQIASILLITLMLQPKRSSHQIINLTRRQTQSPSNYKGFHIRRTESKNILQAPAQVRVDLDVESQQGFVCFECANQQVKGGCRQCGGTGLLGATHPLVLLMNDIFNAKFSPSSSQPYKKDMVSTKTSSHSNVSDSFTHSDKSSTPSSHKNSPKSRQIKHITSPPQPQQPQKLPFLDTLLPTLPSMIKQQSTIEQKSKKCNICHYQFQSVKYMCPQCQNYNVCEQCYQTKRISHCHQLRKMQSVSSQGVGKVEESQRDQGKGRKHVGEVEHGRHDEGSRLSLQEDKSGQLILGNPQKPAPFPSNQPQQPFLPHTHPEQHPSTQGLAFFKLHQVQSQHNPTQLCNTCHQHLQDCCYWFCETCKEQGRMYQLCKECYDHQMYQHPKEHRLGLNFFTLEDDFLAVDGNGGFFDHVREDAGGEEEFVDFKAQSSRQQKTRSIPSTPSLIKSNSKLTSTPISLPEMLNIGRINGHKNIFPGFHTQTPQNQHYKNQIISPIPRALKLPHSFKDTKQPNVGNQSDGDIMVELMSSSVNSTPKKSIEVEEKTPKKKKEMFGDQSRVYFGDNVMMNWDLSQDYNENTQHEDFPQLYRSEIKYHEPTSIKPKKIANLFPNITLLQINPQTSIMESNITESKNQHQDYYFTTYYCDICNINPIKNIKYHCLECEDYDLCEECYEKRRVEHWHDHFRKDDGRLKSKKILQNKKRIITKAVNNLNRSLSPTRRSFMC